MTPGFCKPCRTACLVLLLGGVLIGKAPPIAAAQSAKSAAGKKSARRATAKSADKNLDPVDRPEGKIVDQPARYYLWFETQDQSWRIRTTARRLRNFNATVKVQDGTIQSCVGIGLKNVKRKYEGSDGWRVTADRKTLILGWQTAQKSDGVDVKIEGDQATLEFDFLLDGKRIAANAVFIGKLKQHPAAVPFKLPALPSLPNEKPGKAPPTS